MLNQGFIDPTGQLCNISIRNPVAEAANHGQMSDQTLAIVVARVITADLFRKNLQHNISTNHPTGPT